MNIEQFGYKLIAADPFSMTPSKQWRNMAQSGAWIQSRPLQRFRI